MHFRPPKDAKPLNIRLVRRFYRLFDEGRSKEACIAMSGLGDAPWQQTTNLWKSCILAENGPDFYN